MITDNWDKNVQKNASYENYYITKCILYIIHLKKEWTPV